MGHSFPFWEGKMDSGISAWATCRNGSARLFDSDYPPLVARSFNTMLWKLIKKRREEEMTKLSIQSPCSSVLKTLGVMIGVSLLCMTASAQGHPDAKTSKQTIIPATEKQFKFDVASIRPQKPGTVGMYRDNPSKNGYQSGGTSVRALLGIAYTPYATSNSGLLEVQNAPKWISEQPIVVDARVAEKDLAAWQAQGSDLPLFRSALRDLLSERYKLKVHVVESQAPYWDLVVAHNGPKLQEASQTDIIPNGLRLWPLYNGGSVEMTQEKQRYFGATIGELASILSRDSYPQPVQDKTGLTKRYNLTLEYDDLGDSGRDVTLQMVSKSLAKLGLSLKKGKGPALTIVIDHIEPLSPN
jgi:uncharacterized protein (TIGR03435 family)